MAKLGDVFGIDTSKGWSYFQLTGKNALMGQLIRVLPGTYPEGKPDLNDLLERETNFWIFFPIEATLKIGRIKKVGNFPVPEHSLGTPIFRTGVIDPTTGKVKTWWLWDGEKEWKVGQISNDQRKFPIRGSWNAALLKERIEEGWLPENDST